MIIATRYVIEKEMDFEVWRVRNLDAPFCPSCGSLCSGYDTRSRRVVGGDGCVTVYRLRRVRCPSCNVLHIEMPDFIYPRKHYTAEVINNVREGGGDDCPADASTMWRWRQENSPPGLQCFSSENEVQSNYSIKKGDKP